MKIFLDDIRLPEWIYDDFQDWVLVKNRDEFEKIILDNKSDIDIISLDNDLGTDLDGNILFDGYSCLNWLIDNDIYIKNIIIHSDNIVASEQIYGKANNWINFLVSENILKKEEVSVLKRPSMQNLRFNKYIKKIK